MSIHFYHFYSNYYTDGELFVLPLFFGFQLCHRYARRMLMKRVYIYWATHIFLLHIIYKGKCNVKCTHTWSLLFIIILKLVNHQNNNPIKAAEKSSCLPNNKVSQMNTTKPYDQQNFPKTIISHSFRLVIWLKVFSLSTLNAIRTIFEMNVIGSMLSK